MSKPRWTIDEFREVVATEERRDWRAMIFLAVTSLALAAATAWPLVAWAPPEFLPPHPPPGQFIAVSLALTVIYSLLAYLLWLRHRAFSTPAAPCRHCDANLVDCCSLVIATRNCPRCGRAQLEELAEVDVHDSARETVP